jgi:hypothetical protein
VATLATLATLATVGRTGGNVGTTVGLTDGTTADEITLATLAIEATDTAPTYVRFRDRAHSRTYSMRVSEQPKR